MSESHHFRAYTYVDRILAVQPGVSARGAYHIPTTLAEFSGSLVAEATGQLAAWSALGGVFSAIKDLTGHQPYMALAAVGSLLIGIVTISSLASIRRKRLKASKAPTSRVFRRDGSAHSKTT